MSLLQNGNLLKFVSDKVKGFEVKRINAVSGIYVVDTKGYIGLKINDYFSQNGSPYPGNYALVAKGPSYKDLGLGQVTFIDNLQGQVTIGDKTYRTVIMPDGKEWMAENLDYKADGITISTAEHPITTLPTTATAWYYNNDEATYGWEGKKYGLIYNWYAVAALTIAGWHVPTYDEWTTLINSLGSNPGTKGKSTTGWDRNGNGTDDYGFNVLPAGRYYQGTGDAGLCGIFWSRSEYDNNHRSAWRSAFSYDSVNVSCDAYLKVNGYSVRLVKDSA